MIVSLLSSKQIMDVLLYHGAWLLGVPFELWMWKTTDELFKSILKVHVPQL